MRNLSAVLVVALLGACGRGPNVQPVAVSAPTPDSTSVTMECVTRELDNQGYDTDLVPTEPGTVTGIRLNEKPWYVRWLYGNTADQITATIDNGQLRVTAASTDPNGLGDDSLPTTAASDAATRNAQSILETCARAG